MALSYKNAFIIGCVLGVFGGVFMETKTIRIVRNGKACRVKLAKHGDYMTESFAKAVSDAIDSAKANGKPIARYDRQLDRAYMEYPDGTKVYS